MKTKHIVPLSVPFLTAARSPEKAPVMRRGAQGASAVLMALVVGWLAIGRPASAATLRWTGGALTSNNWSQGANWDTGIPPVDGDTVVFPAGALRVNNANDLTGLRLAALRFSGAGGGYVLIGNGVTVTNGITATNSIGMNTISLARITLGQDLPFNVPQSGATLLITSEVRLNGFDLSLKTIGALELSGVISGTGNLIKEDDGTLTLSGPADNTFSGDVQVNAGVLEMNKSSGLAVPNRLIIGDGLGGAQADQARSLSSNQVRQVTVNGSGLWQLRGNTEIINDLVLNGVGDVQTGPAGNLRLSLGANVTVNPSAVPLPDAAHISGNLELLLGGHNFNVGESFGGLSDPTELIIDADISGLGFINKQGAGDLMLSGNNSFEGVVNVNAGELRLTSSTALGTTLSGTVVNNDASVSLQGSLQVISEHLTLNSSGLTGLVSRPALQASGSSNFWSGPVTFQSNSRIGVTTNDLLNLSGAFDGPGSVVKEDTGTLRFSGPDLSDFSGDIFINAGVLELDHAPIPGGIPNIPGTIFVGDGVGGAHADVLRNLNTLQVGFGLPFGSQRAWPVVVNGSGLWDLNGFNDLVSLLELLHGGDVRTGATGNLKILTGLVASPGPAPDDEPARISGNVQFDPPNFPIVVEEGEVGSGDPSDLIIDADMVSLGFIKSGSGDLQLSGANYLVGPIEVDSGELRLNSPGSLDGTLDRVTVVSNATLWLQGDFSIGYRPLVLNSSGSTIPPNNNPALQASGTNFWQGDIFLAQDTRIGVATNGILLLSGAITGPGGVVKENPGDLVYFGGNTNTYNGLTSVEAGRLILSKTGGVPHFAGNLIVGDDAGGVDADVVECASPGLNASNSAVWVKGSGLLHVPNDAYFGAIVGDGHAQVDAVLDVGLDNRSTTFDGLITGSGVVNKLGSGTLTLTGSNTIAGLGALDGKLLVDGRQPGSAVVVLGDGLLGGSGRVGPVLGAAGTISPGDSPGELETGNLILEPGITLVMELAGPNPGTDYDRLKVHGNVNLAGGLDVRLSYVPAYGQVFTIIENDGSNPVNGTFFGMPEGAIIDKGAAQLLLSYQGGPSSNNVTLTALAQPCPPAQLAIALLTNSQVELSWTGCPSNSYRLAVTTNFQNWAWLTPPLAAPPTNGLMTFTAPATSLAQFFRLAVHPLGANSALTPSAGEHGDLRLSPATKPRGKL